MTSMKYRKVFCFNFVQKNKTFDFYLKIKNTLMRLINVLHYLKGWKFLKLDVCISTVLFPEFSWMFTDFWTILTSALLLKSISRTLANNERLNIKNKRTWRIYTDRINVVIKNKNLANGTSFVRNRNFPNIRDFGEKSQISAPNIVPTV